jgi:hypothetical protein
MIAILLLNGSGVLSSLHKLTHLSGDSEKITHCDHGSGHHEHPSEDGDQPKPDHDDEGCEICLGLAGLNLIPIADAPQIVSHAGFVAEPIGSAMTAPTREPLGDQPARAPPAC